MVEKKFRILTSSYTIQNKRVICKTPISPLKITGTRFPAVLGLDKFKSPFHVWCEITRTVKWDFVETPKLRAGRIIEKKLITALQTKFPLIKLQTPEEFPQYRSWPYDYFPQEAIFGGKWDAIADGTMVELKTTAAKNIRYWLNGAPESYLLQAALYAYLSGYDKIILACSFLNEKDYEQPDFFLPILSKYVGKGNSVYFEYSLSNIFPDFRRNQIQNALQFWDEHVLTGISPEFTDKDIASGLVGALYHKINQNRL